MPIKPENRALYPANWQEISRAIRFDRAGGRCECVGECGHDHGGRCEARHLEIHPITGSRVILTTGHRDHNPPNVDPDNLRAWCQRCHLAHDAEHHAKGRLRTREIRRAIIVEKAMQIEFGLERN